MFFKFLLSLIVVGLLPIATLNQSFDVLTFDVGPEFYSSIDRPLNGQFAVRGRIYPAGTYTAKPGQLAPRQACDAANDVQPVGNYLFKIFAGNKVENVGQYVWNFGAWPSITQYYVFGWFYSGVDEQGFPLVNFYPGSILNQPDRVLFIEYTPRSTDCFGGLLKIYLSKIN